MAATCCYARWGACRAGAGNTLRVLSGTQHGWFGKLALAPEFVEALARPVARLADANAEAAAQS